MGFHEQFLGSYTTYPIQYVDRPADSRNFRAQPPQPGFRSRPLLVNYNEALLASEGGPAIDHPFRIAINTGLSMNAFVWPARAAVTAGNPTTGLPIGARLQLTQAWYDANINSFDPIDQAIVTAMYQYGLMVTDLTSSGGIELAGTIDQRSTSELSALGSIPDSAFQVLNTIQPAVTFTGPTAGTAGVPQTFTITYPNASDSNFSTPIYVAVSTNGGTSWNYIYSTTLDDANRGPFTFTYTPRPRGLISSDSTTAVTSGSAPLTSR